MKVRRLLFIVETCALFVAFLFGERYQEYRQSRAFEAGQGYVKVPISPDRATIGDFF